MAEPTLLWSLTVFSVPAHSSSTLFHLGVTVISLVLMGQLMFKGSFAQDHKLGSHEDRTNTLFFQDFFFPTSVSTES